MDGQPRRLMPSAPPARSYFKEVVDLIHRVVPDSTRHRPPPKPDDVSWVKVKTCRSRTGHAATYMILAYANGGQVWQMHENNEAEELLSFRGGRLPCAAIVPESASPPTQDNLFHFRPLLAYCSTDKSSRTKAVIQFTSLKLKTAHPETIAVRGWPRAIDANPTVLVVLLHGEINVYRAENFEFLFNIEDVALLKPSVNLQGSIALGSRWLAYPTSHGPSREATVATPDPMQTMMQFAQQTGERLYYFSDKGYRTVSEFVTGRPSPTHHHSHHSRHRHPHSHHSHGQKPQSPASSDSQSSNDSNGTGAGFVHVIDVKETIARLSEKGARPVQTVCRFRSHVSPIAMLSFNDSGTLLATADCMGQSINVFELAPGALGGVRHLYSLHRGMTQAIIQDIAFSLDDRWVAVASHRGTVHMFPIHPRGNEVDARSHLPVKMPNASEFLQSSGAAQQRQHLGEPKIVRGMQKIRCIAVEADRSHREDSPYTSRTSSASEDINEMSTGGVVAVHFRPPPHADQVPTDTAMLHLLVLTNEGKLNEFQMHVQRKKPPPPSTGHVVGQFLGGFQKLLSRPEHPAARSVAPPEPEPPVQTEEIELLTAPKQLWNLCRAESWPDMMESTKLLEQSSGPSPHAYDDSASLSPGTAKQRRWLSEVEMKTHMPPHRSLWLGPQFTFNVYSAPPIGAKRQGGNRSTYMEHNGFFYEPISNERPPSSDKRPFTPQTSEGDAGIAPPDSTVDELVQALGQVWEGPPGTDTATGTATSSGGAETSSRTRAFSLPTHGLPHQQGMHAGAPAFSHRTTAAPTGHGPSSSSSSKPHAYQQYQQQLQSGSGLRGVTTAAPAAPGEHRRSSSTESLPARASTHHQQLQQLVSGRNTASSPDSDSSGHGPFPSARGLGIVLGEVGPEDEVPRVHSHVSLDGLMEAFSDDSDD